MAPIVVSIVTAIREGWLDLRIFYVSRVANKGFTDVNLVATFHNTNKKRLPIVLAIRVVIVTKNWAIAKDVRLRSKVLVLVTIIVTCYSLVSKAGNLNAY